MLPRTGLLLQNRGVGFSLEQGAEPARARPAPFHTLNPRARLVPRRAHHGVWGMGGDGQPQVQARLFTRHVLYRQPLEQAIDRPRWLLGRTWGSAQTNLRLKSGSMTS